MATQDDAGFLLLDALASDWKASSLPEVNSAAAEIATLLSSSRKSPPWTDPHSVKTPPPHLPPLPPSPLADALAAAWPSLSWKVPKKLSADYEQKMSASSSSSSSASMKSAMLIGDSHQWGAQLSSSTCYMGLMYIAPNVDYPRHAHTAAEFFQVISGSSLWSLNNASSVVPPGSFQVHPPNQPHGVVTSSEPLLCAYYWSGDLTGPYWFTSDLCVNCECQPVIRCVECADDTNTFASINKGSYEDPEKYYDDMSSTYTETLASWGYEMPKLVAQTLASTVASPSTCSVLDLGCGDGLVGAELAKLQSFSKLTGVDISASMMAVAEARGVYTEPFVKADLTVQLPLSAASFDALLCVGTTTYMTPEVIREWLRLLKPGGLCIFTHKTAVWGAWEPAQEEVVEEGLWEKVSVSEELPYLPGFSEEARETERAKIYCYRKR